MPITKMQYASGIATRYDNRKCLKIRLWPGGTSLMLGIICFSMIFGFENQSPRIPSNKRIPSAIGIKHQTDSTKQSMSALPMNPERGYAELSAFPDGSQFQSV